MDERLQQETQQLIASWAKHDPAMLRDYLVEDVEDPRLNVQSILTRHHLIEALFPGRFIQLMEHELRFSNVMNWGLTLRKKSVRQETMQALVNALVMDEPEIEGLKVPAFVREAFALLPADVDGVTVPDYVSDLLLSPPHPDEIALPDILMRTFSQLWSALLAQQEGMSHSVLEVACGSANDYRFIDAFGIARFLSYAGIDLAEKNIANARQMFPQVHFAVGNAMQIEAPDKSFDHVIAHDLFEHLSIEAMEVAVGEVCRVARQSLCIGFFNLHEGDAHEVKQVDAYHWNRLSVPRLVDLFAQHGGEATFTHIDTMLTQRFGYDRTHNKGAYTAVVRFPAA